MILAVLEQQRRSPIMLNTSFNENGPVVRRPRAVVECFLRTRMDVLVLGQRVIERG